MYLVSYEERLNLLNHKPKRFHKKRHSVNRERSRECKAQAAEARQNAKAAKAARKQFLEAARAYWAGLRDGHP